MYSMLKVYKSKLPEHHLKETIPEVIDLIDDDTISLSSEFVDWKFKLTGGRLFIEYDNVTVEAQTRSEVENWLRFAISKEHIRRLDKLAWDVIPSYTREAVDRHKLTEFIERWYGVEYERSFDLWGTYWLLHTDIVKLNFYDSLRGRCKLCGSTPRLSNMIRTKHMAVCYRCSDLKDEVTGLDLGTYLTKLDDFLTYDERRDCHITLRVSVKIE